MGLYEDGIKVRLRVDLGNYHPALGSGADGVTTPPVGRFAAVSNRYVSVKFDGLTEPVDVLWRHLEITDERIEAIEAEHRKKREERLRTRVTSAIKTVGARGGFRLLTLFFADGIKEQIRRKREADEILKILRDNGVQVTKRRV